MNLRPLLLAFALAGALVFAGCAVNDSTTGGPSSYAPPPVSPARAGLLPAYRVFFDELRDDGDWTLIEPYGWVFRPRVNFESWRPYQEGWWEPSDYYGWIWVSTEPFGWVTYHYGTWFYDEYQGWVWAPGSVWGPAWVAWVAAGDYVGWAPLAPSQYDGYDQVPGGVFTYASALSFGSHDVGTQSLFVTRLPEAAGMPHEIVNLGHVEGVAFNRGPDPGSLRQLGASVPAPGDPSEIKRVKLSAPPPGGSESELRARNSRVITEGVRELRAFHDRGQAPPPAPAVHGAPPPVPTPVPTPTPGVSAPREHVPTPGAAPEPVREVSPREHATPPPAAAVDSTRFRKSHPADNAGKKKGKGGKKNKPRPAAPDSTRKG